MLLLVPSTPAFSVQPPAWNQAALPDPRFNTLSSGPELGCDWKVGRLRPFANGVGLSFCRGRSEKLPLDPGFTSTCSQTAFPTKPLVPKSRSKEKIPLTT